jgi:LacI family transcriptional regulator
MATIYDVAARAGVSTATVSRFLAGQPIRDAEAVRRAVVDLGYTPNAVAQSLKSGRRGAIGVVVPDVTNPFFAAVLKGLEQASRGFEYRVLLANSDESAELEGEILADLAGRVDGFILAPAHEQDAAPLQLHAAGVPVVLIDRELEGGDPFDVVLVDNEGGARAAATHLAGLGHTRIALISGPTNTTPGRGRRDGFLAGLAEAGLEVDPRYDLVGDFREESGQQLTLHLLALDEPPTAIFTANNLMTVGALKALRDMRVRVPEDMSIVGFDDLTLGLLLQPPLTCIERPDVEQGMLAMRLLLSRLTDKAADKPRRIVLETRLLVRESTAAPQRRGRDARTPTARRGRAGKAAS